MHVRDSVMEQALPRRYHATATQEVEKYFNDNDEYEEFEGFSSVSEDEQTEIQLKKKKRIKWDRALNKLVMKCYIMSEPNKGRFRKRMLFKWQDIGVFTQTE